MTTAAPPSSRAKWITPFRAMALCCLFMAGLVISKLSPETGFTALLGFGSKWDGRRTALLGDSRVHVKKGSGGYDAQFYSQVALDPTLRHPDFDDAGRFLDWPSYRARRIGLPLVAHAAGFGRPAWVLTAFALINVSCWTGFAALVWCWLRPTGWFDFARWFFCCFAIGSLESVRLAQTDLPAMLLALTPALYPKRFTAFGRGVSLAFSVFVKETALLGFASLPWRRELRASVWTTLLAVIPFGLWLFYVYIRLGSSAGDTSNFGVPFSGVADYLLSGARVIGAGFDDGRFWFGVPACIGLLAQAAWLAHRRDWNSPVWRLAAAYALLVPFVSIAVWGGHWNVGRVLLPMTVGFNLLFLRRDRAGWAMLFLVNSPACIHGIIRFL